MCLYLKQEVISPLPDRQIKISHTPTDALMNGWGACLGTQMIQGFLVKQPENFLYHLSLDGGSIP
jgi:hypothetical protein